MKKLLLLTTIMMALTGCPDGGKSNNNRVYPNGASCYNCTFSQSPMGQTIASTLPQGTLALTLLGNNQQMAAWAQYTNPLFAYQGPLMTTGSLSVVSDLIMGNCRLPVGNYSLRTIQAGVYDRGVFQLPAIELVGPVRAVIALTEGVILTDGNGSITGFGAMMYGINGPSGWNMGYQPYGGGYGPGSAQINCGDSIGVRF